jgi:hypothetical protein
MNNYMFIPSEDFFSTRLGCRPLAWWRNKLMAGDFFELFKNACSFFCARHTTYWLVEMETSNILSQV